jgi:hypothetical protein
MGVVRALDDFIAEAARQLKADGWRIARCRGGGDAAWHLAATRGAKWRVVQVLVPATAPARRQRDKMRLGEAAQLSANTGRMEQWLAHVRPGGYVTFGQDVLSGTAWARNETEPQWRERLGLSVRDEARGTSESVAPPPAPR